MFRIRSTIAPADRLDGRRLQGGRGSTASRFPGSTFNIDTNVIAIASLVPGPGEAGVDPLGGAIQVRTYTSTGVPSDGAFTVSVFDASPTG